MIDEPTIATKLISPPGTTPVYETWFAWEDQVPPALTPTIWYCVGQYISAPPGFMYMILPAEVPYSPIPPNPIEQNPELWNRNDVLRLNPPFTHLVSDINPYFRGIEVVYIDP
jgi:hypothetical protein